MQEQHGCHQEDSRVEPGSEAFFLVEIEEGKLPVVEAEPLLQSQRGVEIRLHGEHVDDDQDGHRSSEREGHSLGSERICSEELHLPNVGRPPTSRTVSELSLR